MNDQRIWFSEPVDGDSPWNNLDFEDWEIVDVSESGIDLGPRLPDEPIEDAVRDILLRDGIDVRPEWLEGPGCR